MDKIARIRQEIERLKGICTTQIKANPEQTFPFVMEMTGYDKLISFLDTISKEPDTPEFPETFKICLYDGRTPNKENCNECSTTCSVRKEEPDKSLEEEIQRYLREECSGEDEPTVSEIAHHFAEWQYQKDRGEFAKIKAKTWSEGYDEGLVKGAASQRVKLFEEGLNAVHQNNPSIIEKTIAGVFVKYGMDRMKEEILKDAVEGEVYKFGEVSYVKERNNAELTKYLSQFNNGDKVRIVVLKEEE